MNNICYVTAFLDIGRNDWKHFNRSVETYFNSFLNLCNLFDKTENKLIIFLDDKYEIKGEKENINVIKINEDFLKSNFIIWNRIEEEKRIMESENYKNLINHKLHCPEHNNYKYTLINHSKIEFIEFAIKKNPEFKYFSWIDFGYLSEKERIPKSLIELKNINQNILKKIENNICFMLLNYIDYRDENSYYTLINAPEKVCGTFFIGKRQNLLKYYNLYLEEYYLLQKSEIVDDDQHLVLNCYFKSPELFHFFKIQNWRNIMKFFDN